MSYGHSGGYGGCQMQVESTNVGRIIGRGGIKIRELEHESNAKIKISREEDDQGYKTVDISGSDDEIAHAKQLIEGCLQQDYRGGRGGYHGRSGFGRRDDGWGGQRRDRDDGWGRRDYDRGDRGYGESDSIFVEKSEVGRIIGRGGSRIRDMEAESGCKIKVSRDGTSSSEVVLEGSRQSISHAKQLIQDTGVEILDGPGDQSSRGW